MSLIRKQVKIPYECVAVSGRMIEQVGTAACAEAIECILEKVCSIPAITGLCEVGRLTSACFACYAY